MDILLRSVYDPVILVICALIAACFFKCIRERKLHKFSQSTTTVLGIVGTFIGISIGLFDFSPDDIEKSVRTLLFGLQTAFITSIVGIVATLATRTLPVMFPRIVREPSEDRPEGATVQTLADFLHQQIETGKANHEKTLERLERIRASVSGEGDTSMLTQIQKLRTTFTDKQDELIREFRDFAETMAEANSQKLIEALEEVMRDFNAKINEQFGDNFKQLNEAVGALVGWQDKNKEQTERMIEQFDRAVAGIDQVRESIARTQASLSQMAERSEAITEAAEKLDPILTAIQEQRQYMEGYLREFADMSEKAQELLPALDAKISELTENFAESVRGAVEANQESLSKQKDFAQKVIAGFSELDKTASGAIEQVGALSRQSMERMRAQVSNATEQQQKLVADLVERLDAQVRDTFTKTEQEIIRLAGESARNTEARMKAIDEGLGEELTKALAALGDRLASISEKFASDYTPLADALNRAQNIIKR